LNFGGAIVTAQSKQASFEKAGLKVKMLPYPPGATDLIGTATQMQGYDVASPTCTFPDCPVIAKAMAQVGWKGPVVIEPLFVFLPPQAYPGGDYPHWILSDAAANLAYPDKEVLLFRKVGPKYGLPADKTGSVFAGFGWTDVMTLAKVMNEIPYGTLAGKGGPAAVIAKLRAFTGPLVLGPPKIDCSGKLDPSQPNSCNNTTRYDLYVGGGKWKRLSSWIGP
jgi:hypothetical protein